MLYPAIVYYHFPLYPFAPAQFNRFADEEGMISERNFAASLLDYAEINDKRKIKMLRRVRKAFKAEDPESKVCVWVDGERALHRSMERLW